MSLVHRLRQRFIQTPLSPFFLARRGITRALQRSAGYVQGVVLDIGCGNKPYQRLFKATRYVGIDLPRNLNQSRVVDVYASGLAIPFASETFDAVVCSEVLEHVPNPDTLLSEARRVLRRGGHLVLTTPQTWGLHEEPHDYFRYTKYGLTALATRSGFDVVITEATSGFWITWAARTSDFLFQQHAAGRGLVVEGLFGVIAAGVQGVGWLLDLLYRGKGDTLDTLLVARRR